MITPELLKQLPNVRVISTVSQQDDEKSWLAVRNCGIGGSDVGAICGVSPFTSARQIYFNKTGQYSGMLEPNAAAAERMHFGHLLEPIVADEFAKRELTEEKGRAGWYCCDLGGTVCHKDFDWQRANVDRLICDADGNVKGILECKTTSAYNDAEWAEGDILLSYVYQLNWYLYVLDLKWGAFACLVGGNKFYTYEVYRNDELLSDTILPAVTSFWFNNVKALVEPELQAVDAEFANQVYAEVKKGAEVTLDDDESDDLADVVVSCKNQIKELTKTMEEAQNRLKDRLKTAEIGYCRNHVVKWSPRAQSRLDTTALKHDLPEIFNKYTKTIEFRVMSVKELES